MGSLMIMSRQGALRRSHHLPSCPALADLRSRKSNAMVLAYGNVTGFALFFRHLYRKR